MSLRSGKSAHSRNNFLCTEVLIFSNNSLSLAFRRALFDLAPGASYRRPLTWSNVPKAFAYFGPFVFMAYLVRRRDTRLIRLLMLPTVVVMVIHGTFAYSWFRGEYYLFTWARGELLCT